MSFQSFSESNLRRILRPADFFQSDHLRTIDDFDPAIERAAKEVRERTLSFDNIHSSTKRGKQVLQLPDLFQKILVRKLNDTLTRVYKTRQANRSQVCRAIQTLLSDPTPYEVVKCDIKSFFESVPKQGLQDAVSRNQIFAPATKWVFRCLFQSPAVERQTGLPRGLPTSSTLSEKYLEKFDDRIKRREGVFYYARFVDDIIAFSAGDSSKLLSFMVDELGELGLSVNTAKTKRFSNHKESYSSGTHARFPAPKFDFLGYRFSKISHNAPAKVSIARSKINKIKSRVARSFLAYTRDQDTNLLEQRIKFLTSNYFVANSSSSNPLRAGIFYNYSIADDAEEQMHLLDCFLRAQILCRKNIPFKHGFKLAANVKSKLLKYTFKAGFVERKLHRFTAPQIAEIKSCWQDV